MFDCKYSRYFLSRQSLHKHLSESTAHSGSLGTLIHQQSDEFLHSKTPLQFGHFFVFNTLVKYDQPF